MLRRYLFPLVAGLLLAGCWVTSQEIQTKKDQFDPTVIVDTDTTLDVIDIVSIVPSTGTAAGGTEITIKADDLTNGVEVLFGDQTAEVVLVDNDLVVVLSPKGAVGATKVSVRTSTGLGEEADGYYYWPDGTGLVGAIGSYSWVEPQLDFAGELAEGYLWFAFVEPTDLTYGQLYIDGDIESCQSNHEFDFDALDYLESGAPSATLANGPNAITVNYYASDNIFSGDLKEGANWQPSTPYRLELANTNSPFPTINLDKFTKTPARLDLIGPTTGVLGSLLTGSFDVEWNDDQPGNYVVIIADRMVEEGQGDSITHLERVTCVVEDDGLFRVKNSDWQAFDTRAGEYLILQVGRVNEVQTLLPHNNSRSGFVGVFWAIQGLPIGLF